MFAGKPKYKKCSQYKAKKHHFIEEEEKTNTR